MANNVAPKTKSKWNINNNNSEINATTQGKLDDLKNNVNFYKFLLPEVGKHEEELEGKINAFNESITAFNNTIQNYTQNAPNNSLIEKVKSSYQTISDFKDTYNELNTDISSYSNKLKAIVDDQIENEGVNVKSILSEIIVANKNNKKAVNPELSINSLKIKLQTEYDTSKNLNNKTVSQQIQAQLGPLFNPITKLIEQYKALNESYKLLYTTLQNWTNIHQTLEANIISLIKSYYDIDNNGISNLLAEINNLLETRNESKIDEIFQKLIEIKEKLLVARSNYDAYYVSNQAITNLKHKAFGNNFNNGVALLATLDAFEESINNAIGSFKEIVSPKREKLIQSSTQLYSDLIEKIKGCLTSNGVVKNQNNIVSQQNELLSLLQKLETQDWTDASQYSQENKNKISSSSFNDKLKENVNRLSNNIKKKLNIKQRNVGNIKTIGIQSMTGNNVNSTIPKSIVGNNTNKKYLTSKNIFTPNFNSSMKNEKYIKNKINLINKSQNPLSSTNNKGKNILTNGKMILGQQQLKNKMVKKLANTKKNVSQSPNSPIKSNKLKYLNERIQNIRRSYKDE